MAVKGSTRPYKGDAKIGDVNGRLTLVSINNHVHVNGKRYCWVKCSCGTPEKEIAVVNFVHSTKSKSCGCLKTEQNQKASKSIHELGISKMRNECTKHLREIKKKRDLDLPYLLKDKELAEIIYSNCHYCGCSPKGTRTTLNGRKETYKVSGVDRKCSETGYTRDNCVPACWQCNNMKGRTPYSDFIEHMKKILTNLEKINERI